MMPSYVALAALCVANKLIDSSLKKPKNKLPFFYNDVTLQECMIGCLDKEYFSKVFSEVKKCIKYLAKHEDEFYYFLHPLAPQLSKLIK